MNNDELKEKKDMNESGTRKTVFSVVCSWLTVLTLPIRKNPGFFSFMYVLGVVCAWLTLPKTPKAHVYENLYLELFFDLYLLCAILTLIPHVVRRWVKVFLAVLLFVVAVADGGLVDTNRNDELTKITDDLGSKGYDIFVEWMDEYDYGSQFSKSYTYIVGFTQESEVQNFVFPEKTVVRDSGPNAYAVDPVTLPSSQLLEEKGLAPEYNLFGHENEPAVNQAIIDTISPNVGEALARAISKVKVTVMKKIGEF